MPLYVYKHPDTNQEFEELRSFSDRDNLFKAPDGVICERVLFPSAAGVIDKNAEVWEKDPDYVKKLNPRWVKTRSGQKIRYDPKKHF